LLLVALSAAGAFQLNKLGKPPSRLTEEQIRQAREHLGQVHESIVPVPEQVGQAASNGGLLPAGPTDAAGDLVDSLHCSYGGWSEILWEYSSIYTAVKHVNLAAGPTEEIHSYCGYYGVWYPDYTITERSWFEWDITEIPDSSRIDSIKAAIYCDAKSGTVNNLSVYPMRWLPSVQDYAETLYFDAGDTVAYGTQSPTGLGWRTIKLGGAASADFVRHQRQDNIFPAGYTATGPGGAVTWELSFQGQYMANPPHLIVYFVPPHDVGVTAIKSPSGSIDSGTVVTPACSVYNYGLNTENYTVRMKIGSLYDRTATVAAHQSGTYAYVTFPNWVASPVGVQMISCSTQLVNDSIHSNDKRTSSVNVARPVIRDVGCAGIRAPTGIVDSSATPINPVCSLYNYGNTTVSYSVLMIIEGTSYNKLMSVFEHAPGTYWVQLFDGWEPRQRGPHAVRCSTVFSLDMNPGNDRRVDTVKVRVRDVGALVIVAPSGNVDSGASVTPACTLYNYGTSTENYTARMKIGSSYNMTMAVSGHAGGAKVVVTFPSWTAMPRGSLGVSCSTELSGDVQPLNDKAGGSVNVNVTDVGCTKIIAPTGTYDDGTIVSPACSVYNFGTTTPGSYSVRMKIGPSYNNTVSITGPAPGGRTYVTFTNWTATPVGTYTVSCSTELATDQDRLNDRKTGQVIVAPAARTDVGVSHILAPPGALDSGATTTPACSVENFGTTTPGSYTVRMKIGAGYNNTATISGPAPNARIYVTFLTWTAQQRGSQAVSCSTELASDQLRANDKATSSVNVNVTDVGCTHLLAPTGAIDSGTAVTPACSVYNYGTTTPSSYTVRMKIGASYSNTVSITGPAPGTRAYVTFPSWIARPRGSYPVSCSTELADAIPGDDKATTSVTVAVTDVGCTHVLAPAGSIGEGTTVTPACSVYNFGTTTPGSYPVRMKIGSFYNATAQITGPAPNARVYVTFPNWLATQRGTHNVSCSTELASDQVRGNDRHLTTVEVTWADVGCTRILAPAGVLDSGATVTPACSVYNFGTQTPGSYTVRMKIGASYSNPVAITGPAPGARVYVTFPVWTAQPRGSLAVSCSTELGDADASNNRATGSVTVAVGDVGCTRILAPAGALDSGTTVTPACSVYNYGTTTPGIYTVRMKIGASYNNTALASGPGPGARVYVTFPAWTALPRGSLAVSCSTELGDAIPGNDKTSGSVLVNVSDVGCTRILAPAGTLDSGTTVTPISVNLIT
jgi:hypothetical protein